MSQVASPDVAGILASAKSIPQAAYKRAMQVLRPRFAAGYAAYFAQNRLDAVIFPTVPITAPLIDASYSGDVSIDGIPQPGGPAALFLTLVRNVATGPAAGIPGLTIPVGKSPKGLPVGIELDRPVGTDRRLLAIGAAMEQLFGRLPAPPSR